MLPALTKFQFKDRFFKLWDSHYKDGTTSYLDHGNLYTSKLGSLYWNGSRSLNSCSKFTDKQHVFVITQAKMKMHPNTSMSFMVIVTQAKIQTLHTEVKYTKTSIFCCLFYYVKLTYNRSMYMLYVMPTNNTSQHAKQRGKYLKNEVMEVLSPSSKEISDIICWYECIFDLSLLQQSPCSFHCKPLEQVRQSHTPRPLMDIVKTSILNTWSLELLRCTRLFSLGLGDPCLGHVAHLRTQLRSIIALVGSLKNSQF